MNAKVNSNTWYLDNGCSKHMTGEKNQFSKFEIKSGRYVTFGDNPEGKIIGKGEVGKEPSPIIKNVSLVDGLKHNLLSISHSVI